MSRTNELTVAATISGFLNVVLAFVVTFWGSGNMQILAMVAFVMCIYVIIINILIIRERDKV